MREHGEKLRDEKGTESGSAEEKKPSNAMTQVRQQTRGREQEIRGHAFGVPRYSSSSTSKRKETLSTGPDHERDTKKGFSCGHDDGPGQRRIGGWKSSCDALAGTGLLRTSLTRGEEEGAREKNQGLD